MAVVKRDAGSESERRGAAAQEAFEDAAMIALVLKPQRKDVSRLSCLCDRSGRRAIEQDRPIIEVGQIRGKDAGGDRSLYLAEIHALRTGRKRNHGNQHDCDREMFFEGRDSAHGSFLLGRAQRGLRHKSYCFWWISLLGRRRAVYTS